MSGSDLRVEVPPDVDVEDRVIGPLTFRHVGYLALAGAGAAVAVLHATLAAIVFGAMLVIVGTAGAAWRPQGRPLDTWLGPARAYRERTRSAARLTAAVPAPAPPTKPTARKRRVRRLRTAVTRLTPRLPAWVRNRQRSRPGRRAVVAAVAVMASAGAAATYIAAARSATVPRHDIQPVDVAQRTSPPSTPRPTEATPRWSPRLAPTLQPPRDLTDQEIHDAVDALFDSLTGP